MTGKTGNNSLPHSDAISGQKPDQPFVTPDHFEISPKPSDVSHHTPAPIPFPISSPKPIDMPCSWQNSDENFCPLPLNIASSSDPSVARPATSGSVDSPVLLDPADDIEDRGSEVYVACGIDLEYPTESLCPQCGPLSLCETDPMCVLPTPGCFNIHAEDSGELKHKLIAKGRNCLPLRFGKVRTLATIDTGSQMSFHTASARRHYQEADPNNVILLGETSIKFVSFNNTLTHLVRPVYKLTPEVEGTGHSLTIFSYEIPDGKVAITTMLLGENAFLGNNFTVATSGENGQENKLVMPFQNPDGSTTTISLEKGGVNNPFLSKSNLILNENLETVLRLGQKRVKLFSKDEYQLEPKSSTVIPVFTTNRHGFKLTCEDKSICLLVEKYVCVIEDLDMSLMVDSSITDYNLGTHVTVINNADTQVIIPKGFSGMPQ